jgi:gliding motility-associated-like protein
MPSSHTGRRPITVAIKKILGIALLLAASYQVKGLPTIDTPARAVSPCTVSPCQRVAVETPRRSPIDSVTLVVQPAACGRNDGRVLSVVVSGGQEPYEFSLNGTDYHDFGNFINLPPMPYTYYVRDALGQVFQRPFVIEHLLPPVMRLSPADTTVCPGDVVTLRLSGELGRLSNITWSVPNIGNTATVTVNQTQEINVTGSDSNVCVSRAKATLLVRTCTIVVPPPPPSQTVGCIIFPNAFTPNADGKNDLLRPSLGNCRWERYQLQVFNRWGQLVFGTQQPGQGWDGTYQGLPQSAGAYLFRCSYTVQGGQGVEVRGSVLLMR